MLFVTASDCWYDLHVHGDLVVTGGTGFVGRSLLSRRSFVDQFDAVHVVGRRSRPQWLPSPFNYVVADLTTDELVTFKDATLIVHAATPASASLNAFAPRDMFFQNISSMESVLSLASQCTRKPTVLFTSSGAVYGEAPGVDSFISEDSRIAAPSNDPRLAYANGKRAAEFLLAEASSRGLCNGVVTRLFSFSGRFLPVNRHFAIGNFVRDAIFDREITVRGDGSAVRSYLDSSDMARWLEASAFKGVPDTIYHIGSDEPISILELAYLVSVRVRILLGKETGIRVLGQKNPTDGFSRYVPGVEHTMDALGVWREVSLAESIDDMIKFCLRDEVEV